MLCHVPLAKIPPPAFLLRLKLYGLFFIKLGSVTNAAKFFISFVDTFLPFIFSDKLTVLLICFALTLFVSNKFCARAADSLFKYFTFKLVVAVLFFRFLYSLYFDAQFLLVMLSKVTLIFLLVLLNFLLVLSTSLVSVKYFTSAVILGVPPSPPVINLLNASCNVLCVAPSSLLKTKSPIATGKSTNNCFGRLKIPRFVS